jgi:hypothetical protein
MPKPESTTASNRIRTVNTISMGGRNLVGSERSAWAGGRGR